MSSLRRRHALPVTLTVLAALLGGCTGEESPSADPTPPAPASSPTDEQSSSAVTPSPEESPTGSRVRSTFFGMHDGRVTQGVLADAPIGAVRLWDSGTSWLHLETGPGSFTWKALDVALSTAASAGVRPLLVLGQTPVFHASKPEQAAPYGPGAASMPDLEAWRRYVTAVADRYGDRIDYQIWNEANVVQYWAGTPGQMVRLSEIGATAIRQQVPEATVVAPAFALRLPSQQRYFEQFWSQLDPGADLDAVSVNLYPLAEKPPEAQLALLDDARAVLAEHDIHLPVWNTEINYGLQGGPEPPAIPDERQRAYLLRTYLLNAGAGVPRVYWYRWDVSRIANTYLTNEDLTTETLAGQSFDTVRRWLDGTAVEECAASDGVWECAARRDGESLRFWWKPQGARAVRKVAGARSWTDADGRVTQCRQTCRVPVGEAPVLVAGGR